MYFNVAHQLKVFDFRLRIWLLSTFAENDCVLFINVIEKKVVKRRRKKKLTNALKTSFVYLVCLDKWLNVNRALHTNQFFSVLFVFSNCFHRTFTRK